MRCCELFYEGFGGYIIDGTGSAFDFEPATTEELNELFILHSDLFGKLMYTNTHGRVMT
jgi:hypothetical protein